MNEMPRGNKPPNPEHSNPFSAAEDLRGEKPRLPKSDLSTLIGYQGLINPDGSICFTFISEGMAQLHGVTPEQFYANPEILYRQMHEEDLPKVRAAESEAIRTNTPFSCELRFRTPSGEIRWALLYSVPRTTPAGDIYWDGIEIDITERQRTERREAERAVEFSRQFSQIVTEISSRFINLDPEDIDQAIMHSLQQIGIFAGADRCYLFFLRQGGSKVDITHEWCAKDIKPDMPVFQDLNTEDYARFAEPILRSEAINIPRLADIVPLEGGKVGEALNQVQSLLLVPMQFGRNVVGCIGLDAVRQEKTWPEAVQALLRVIGEVFASALERKRSEESLRESEQFLRQVIDNAPFGAHFYRLEEGDRLVLVNSNRAADKILKTDHSRLWGLTVEEAFPGLVSTRIPSVYRKIAREGEQYTQEQVDYDEGTLQGAFEINAFQTAPGSMAVFFVDITHRKQTEKALLEEATRRRILFEQSPDGILIVDPSTLKFLDFNTAAHRQLGYSREEFSKLGIPDVDVMETPAEVRARVDSVIRNGHGDFETIQRTKEGEDRNIHVTAQTVNVLGRQVYHCIWRDVTDKKRNEEERNKLQGQLAQAQKMESIGRLAGGVAHDFNNMLGVILGHAEMALDQFSPEQPVHADLEEIRKAAQRSAELTRQLLAFARKQAMAPKTLNLNEAISGLLKMLRRLIGEDTELVWMPTAGLCTVKMDPAQLDQILANLCVNSRDAISGVGRIMIQTQNRTITWKDRGDREDIVPGDYVLIKVSDTGCGMSQEVLDHLFEPFYTTKELGKGTGLGLATVYGIVRQNDGFIQVASKPKEGTSFYIYLPAAPEEKLETAAVTSFKDLQADGKTVLLVEDEPAILNLSETMLRRMGFRVLKALGPGEAIRQAEKHSGTIDVLITDVIMPEMNGRSLAERVALMNPGLKCLFMSGYTADVIAHRGVLDEGVHFIQKPFSARDMAEKIREVLGLN